MCLETRGEWFPVLASLEDGFVSPKTNAVFKGIDDLWTTAKLNLEHSRGGLQTIHEHEWKDVTLGLALLGKATACTGSSPHGHCF